ncbi:MAG TPA: DciA family protein [Terriglobales bacterium]|nr:DciA family protein [Terriglobales bacterium]
MQHANVDLRKISYTLVQTASGTDAAALAWSMVSGAHVANRTRVLGLRAGVLRVEVPGAEWRSQLDELATQYLSAINHVVARKIDRIEFVLPGHSEAPCDRHVRPANRFRQLA